MVKPQRRMAAYEVVYSNLVVNEDIPRLGPVERNRVRDIVESKLTVASDQFGKPLRRPHHGYWVLRIGNYRIAYAISRNIVRVVAILLRDRIYEELTERI